MPSSLSLPNSSALSGKLRVFDSSSHSQPVTVDMETVFSCDGINTYIQTEKSLLRSPAAHYLQLHGHSCKNRRVLCQVGETLADQAREHSALLFVDMMMLILDLSRQHSCANINGPDDHFFGHICTVKPSDAHMISISTFAIISDSDSNKPRTLQPHVFTGTSPRQVTSMPCPLSSPHDCNPRSIISSSSLPHPSHDRGPKDPHVQNTCCFCRIRHHRIQDIRGRRKNTLDAAMGHCLKRQFRVSDAGSANPGPQSAASFLTSGRGLLKPLLTFSGKNLEMTMHVNHAIFLH